jgi:peptidoglycan/LPS O-acetylase OafA/YrhL
MLVALNIHKVPLAGSGAPFYANMLLTAIVVCVCQWTPKGKVASFLDRQIGALSYPVYLTHYQVAVIVITIIEKPISGFSLFFAALPVLFLVATTLEIANRPPQIRQG